MISTGSPDTKLDGRCHCGKIAFEAEGDLAAALICHCTDCQTLSGSPFRAVLPVPADSFRLTAGKPKEYVKMAQSGRPRIQAFCGDCGTPLYAAGVGADAGIYNLRIGCLRQRDQIRPKVQMWHRSAQGWLETLPVIEAVETQ